MLSYSILLDMVCAHFREKGVDVVPGSLTHNIGNAHIYSNHIRNVGADFERTFTVPYS